MPIWSQIVMKGVRQLATKETQSFAEKIIQEKNQTLYNSIYNLQLYHSWFIWQARCNGVFQAPSPSPAYCVQAFFHKYGCVQAHVIWWKQLFVQRVLILSADEKKKPPGFREQLGQWVKTSPAFSSRPSCCLIRAGWQVGRMIQDEWEINMASVSLMMGT